MRLPFTVDFGRAVFAVALAVLLGAVLRDQYVLHSPDTEAEFNPALRHRLRQLYAIDLPETIDLDQHADLLRQHGVDPSHLLQSGVGDIGRNFGL